jgi:hypothetical protein
MWGTRAQGVALVGLIGLSLAAGMALAEGPQNPFAGECNRTATPEDVELAKQAHQAARQFFERGEYARAVQYWRDVWNLDCNAVGTLLNIANAYERLADLQNAIFALEAYAQRKPGADDIEKIKRRIENLKSRLASMPKATASATGPVPTSTASVVTTVTPPTPPPVKPYGVAPWITVGVGGAAIIAGAILLPLGITNVSDSQRQPPTNTKDLTGTREGCYEVVENNPIKATSDPGSGKWGCFDSVSYGMATRGQTQALVGKIALGVGGAAVAGGIVWELLFNKPVPADAAKPDANTTGRIHFAPAFGGGLTGAFLHGSF